MKRTVAILTVGAGAMLVAAGLALWPKQQAQAQASALVNAEGCSCSRPTALGMGVRGEAFVFHCVCPGTQCVITVASAGTASGSPHVAQSCR
jgi:hypothetical protein